MKRIYLDTETSGFKPGSIGQLSYIIEDENGNIEAVNHFYEIKYVSPQAVEALGRTVEFYKDKSKGRKFSEDAEYIANLLNGSDLIAHNVEFDLNFLSIECWRCGQQFKLNQQLDSMISFKDTVNALNKYGRVKNPSLSEVIDYFKINKDKLLNYSIMLFGNDDCLDFHDSRFDVTAMFVAIQIQRERLVGKNGWEQSFCD